MGGTSYKGVRRADRAIISPKDEEATWRAAGTTGQRQEAMPPEPRCSLQAGPRRDDCLPVTSWNHRDDAAAVGDAPGIREKRARNTPMSPSSCPPTQWGCHHALNKPTWRPDGPESLRKAVSAEVHPELQKGERWVSEQAGDDSHTWAISYRSRSQKFPLYATQRLPIPP